MGKHMMLYRGSLKSCNYHCSYCPFSKHLQSKRELEKDKEQWLSFVDSYPEKAAVMDIGALMVVPYGEAMIYPWYWEGLAHISALSETDAVGVQTNLSFSIKAFLDCYTQAGGVVEKARIWATFHPEMTTVSAFVEKCKKLYDAGVVLCAGSVGVPENLDILRKLREELCPSVYLWVNRMDGLQRSYTQQEKEAFLEIDPYFERELVPVRADAARCQGRLFMEADGRLRACNISSVVGLNWAEQNDFPYPKCTRNRCSCYLAYGGRSDFMNRVLFGTYPLFRIPRRPKAVFFDIEGTLMKGTKISADIMAGLESLAREKINLFFATTLPYKDAMKRCRSIRHLFQGGVFAGGAHIVIWGDSSGKGRDARKKEPSERMLPNIGNKALEHSRHKEFFHVLDASLLAELESLKQVYYFRILTYHNGESLYKITLLRPIHRPWSRQEAENVIGPLSHCKNAVRYDIEGNCLQIVSVKADKVGGVELLCRWLGISPKEAVAAGDSELDKGMISICGE